MSDPAPTPFAALAETSRALAATSSRTEKIALLAGALAAVTAEERPIAVEFLSGSIRQGRLGVGWKSLAKAESGVPSTGASLEAEDVMAPPDPGPLTILDVDAAFGRIQRMSGPGSTRRKREALAAILSRATPAERTLLRGLLVGDLRQGAGRGLMLEAIARTTGEEAEAIHRSHTRSANLTDVFGSASAIEVFRPLAPMLAGTATSVSEAVARLGPALVEAKADGARVQVHKRDDEVRVFTRTGNEVTASVPEVVVLAGALGAREAVLDGEVLAWSGDHPQPFQVTMKRLGGTARATRATVPLRVFFFDCLAVDGQDLLDQPLRRRREALVSLVLPSTLLPSTSVGSPEEASAGEALLAEAQATGFEGAVVKALDSKYAAGRRGASWLKVKPVHTLDLVVLAAEWGSGRRTGTLSNLHLGARDASTGDFVMLGKTFKGLTDALLTWQTEALQALETRRTRSTVFVRPELVVEIAFDGVQRSPRYPAGVTLRFARVKRYRPDKTAGEADTVDAVRAILEAQPGTAEASPVQGDLFVT